MVVILISLFRFQEIIKIGEKEYLNSVVGMQLNSEYVAAHMGNQIQLHSLGESVMENRESILLPQDQNEGRVTSFALVKEYLVFSTDVSYFVRHSHSVVRNLSLTLLSFTIHRMGNFVIFTLMSGSL